MRRPSVPAVVLLAAAAVEVAAAPRVERVSPRGLAAGAATLVEFSGRDLENATGLWLSTSVAGEQDAPELVDASAREARFRVRLPADAVGVVAARVVSESGIADPVLLVVDALATAPPEAARDAGGPRELEPPVALDAVYAGETVDRYTVEGRAGECLAFEVIAARLGSSMDPTLRLVGPQGDELAFEDDSSGIGADCRFVARFPRSGTHVLEVRSADFRGGRDSWYRLRVGTFPCPAVAFPLGAQRGSRTVFTVFGAAGRESVPFSVPDDPPGRALFLPVPAGDRAASAFVEIATSDLPDFLETPLENDSIESAVPALLPAAINGVFERPGDRDCYRFEVDEGARLVFTGMTRALGSETDLYLVLRRVADGAVVARNDPGREAGERDDAFLAHTFKQAGAHVLEVEELNHRGGETRVYRIEAQRQQARFSLSSEGAPRGVARAGRFRVKVACERNGYDGPIAFALEGASPGLRLVAGLLPAAKKEADLELAADLELTVGQPLHFRLAGSATIGGEELRVPVSTGAALLEQLDALRRPPAFLDGWFVIAVLPPESP